MVVGLFLLVGVSFASKEGSREHQLIQKNQEQQTKGENVDRIVEGVIYVIQKMKPGRYRGYSDESVRYMSMLYTRVFKQNGYELEISAGDIRLGISVRSKRYAELSKKDQKEISRDDWCFELSDNWFYDGHPRLKNFPDEVPLKLFINEKGELKKEGEEVIIYYNDKTTHERIKIVLTINTEPMSNPYY